jgi:hypothetical protein
MKRKSPPPPRTDEQITAEILRHLDWKASARTDIQHSVNIGIDLARRLLAEMKDAGEIESYMGRIGPNRCEIFCLPGQSPVASLTASGSSTAAEILAGFREAVLSAYSAGNDPFKVAA